MAKELNAAEEWHFLWNTPRSAWPAEAAMSRDDLREQLAAIEHERWAHWQQYVHSKGERTADGSLLLPASLVERWERQIGTAYADLSEAEKASDREQVDRYWPLITDALAARGAEARRRDPLAPERERLGRLVREAWVAYVRETQPNPKPSHVAPWEELSEWDKEADRRIADALCAAAPTRPESTE